MTQSISGFTLPSTAPGDHLQRILNSALNRPGEKDTVDHGQPPYWPAEYFGLNQVTLFQQASAGEQDTILEIANQDLLTEIYWVEQAGMGYMAKMILLAESNEERILYSLFAADEAQHLCQIEQFFQQKPEFNQDSFLSFMGQLLESNDKALLLTMVQVVLEGWGLSHYRSLASHCQNDRLTATLQSFLAAEARHHATGVQQLQTWSYDQLSLENIYQALREFLHMVQVGPQRLVQAVEQGRGYLSPGDRRQIFTELKTEVQSQNKLNLLRSLMAHGVPPKILSCLEEQQCFVPYAAELC
ncbi:ferritin-like domain-containing protein [Synechocystis sp. PCC 7339]|uniref:ferritin-like domain-containing protein n=1 Tax=unclassified Synechocystis TaxID=2640012 RepID=UPI001BB0740F|nr:MULTISPECIES: ferritin-like domain-containing protein [unclassified Synechocystis]QUS60807.1 ferritin-like domain-containing protein [Synechocystis sp. PCC 7338]UAJ72997.1 ferritin-like domain-containing protein [Synechocystis sp. PCC 7339]